MYNVTFSELDPTFIRLLNYSFHDNDDDDDDSNNDDDGDNNYFSFCIHFASLRADTS